MDNLRNRGTIDMGKVTLLRRPIEHAPQLLEREGPFRVVAVSRLSKRKGRNVLNLIAAFERFLETDPQASLQVPHLLGDARLGDSETVPRAAKAASLGDGQEVAQMANLQGIVQHKDRIRGAIYIGFVKKRKKRLP